MGLDIYSLEEINSIIDNLTVSDVNKFIKESLSGADTFISIFNPEKK